MPQEQAIAPETRVHMHINLGACLVTTHVLQPRAHQRKAIRHVRGQFLCPAQLCLQLLPHIRRRARWSLQASSGVARGAANQTSEMLPIVVTVDVSTLQSVQWQAQCCQDKQGRDKAAGTIAGMLLRKEEQRAVALQQFAVLVTAWKQHVPVGCSGLLKGCFVHPRRSHCSGQQVDLSC